MKPIDITVVPTATAIVTVPQICLKKGDLYKLRLCLTKAQKEKYNTIIGNEIVYIKNGVDGDVYLLEDRAGDILYADKLLLGYEYCLMYGNNGHPGNMKHFINLNTPHCSKGYNPANPSDAEVE